MKVTLTQLSEILNPNFLQFMAHAEKKFKVKAHELEYPKRQFYRKEVWRMSQKMHRGHIQSRWG